jgi:hypothetical protein
MGERLVLACLIRHYVERLELSIISVVGLVLNYRRNLSFRLLLRANTVHLHKLVHRKIASTNTNNDSVAFYLHEHSLPVVPVHTFAFSLETHFLPHVDRGSVYVVCQFQIDRVIDQRLVHEEIIFIL